jgi:DNA-directed RNA polymerase beta subunit
VGLMDIPGVPETPLTTGPSVTYRKFDDVDGQRKSIYDQAVRGISTGRPLSNASYRLELGDVGYDDDEFDPQPDDEKQYILKRGSLHRPMKATFRLINQADDSVVEEQRATIANIPHLNGRGLFIRKGVNWGLRNQLRLRPGIYTRRKANGQVESHFNVKPGTGRGFRLMLDPESGVFKMQIGQSTTKLFPLLRSLGVPDSQIKESWGEELYNKNFQVRGGSDFADMRKVLSKLGPSDIEITDDRLMAQALKEAIERTEVDEDSTELTMGQRIKNLSPELLLTTTNKILRVANHSEPDDNRDSQAFQTIHSAEDLVEERLRRDQAGTLRKLLWKATKTGKLGNIPSGVMNPNLNALFEKSGLGATVEDINPFEIYDIRQAVSRMGEGGISSEDAVSRDARGVQSSYLGVIDAGRGPESSRLGLDLRVTDAALKGSDGLLYTRVRNTKTGEIETISARDLAKKTVAFPNEWKSDGKRIAVVRNDNMDYATRDEVDYEILTPGSMMSRATAMIPFAESMKGQRLLMGARMSVAGTTPILVRKANGTVYYGAIESYTWDKGDLSVSIDKVSKQIQWKPVAQFIPHKNVKKMFRVSLTSGRYVDATEDHSFVTLGPDGSLQKIYSQDLTPGAAIPLAGTIPAAGDPYTSEWVVSAGNKHNAHSPVSFPLTRELGWIHGMYLSEGYGSGNDRQNNKTAVTFANCDVDVLERVAQFFTSVGVTASPMSGRSDRKLDRVRVYWTQLYIALAADYGDGAYNKRLPGWALLAPREFREGLLAGYLAGDGGVFLRRGQARVNASSRSQELIVGFGNLCSTLGIYTSERQAIVQTGPGGTEAVQYYFEIAAEHVHRLPALWCARKDSRIANALKWTGKKSCDWIPMYRDLKAEVCKHSARKSQGRHAAYVDIHTRASIRSIMGDDSCSPWLSSGVRWDSVKSVEAVPEADYEYVYDLDMEDNIFLCGNGVFVHNTQQALPLRDAEAPLVQTADDDDASLHAKMGKYMGSRISPIEGKVIDVTPTQIKIQDPQGNVKVVGLYNNYPLARKTVLHNEPLVRPGDSVSPGTVLARSNFTDKDGTTAIGRNLRVAWMSASGSTIEDAVVISESAAKKLMSEGMYKTDLDLDDVKSTKKADFQSVYSDKFTPEQYKKIDDDGVVQIGQQLTAGDPIVLAMADKKGRAIGALMETQKSSVSNQSKVWDHNAPGVVTDVEKTRKGIRVTVKTYDTTKMADKLTTRFGSKGVVSEIRPDDQMPMDEQGRPIEAILNSFGIISRVNPAAMAEALLGKVAEKRGKPYVIKPFATPTAVAQFAIDEAMKYGVIKKDADGNIVDTEELTDPRDGRKLKKIFTGNSYVMKLHHTAESKLSARDQGGYTQEGIPAKGGSTGAKRIGVLDSYSLIAAGATEFMKDAKLIRGQRNDDYWRAIRNGETAVIPEKSLANDMFRNQLTAAGVKLRQNGTRTGLSPLLDKDVDELAQHEITSGDTFDFNTMEPIKGGLFDKAATGGGDGNRFAKITLPVKIPHPLFMDPIQRILGLTGKEMQAIMKGEEKLHGKTGADAIEAALSNVNIDREIGEAKATIKTGSRSHRDAAVKKLNYLTGIKKFDIAAKDLMVSKIPVIPPKYRPITRSNGTEMVHDLNYLYKDLLTARENYEQAKNEFGDAGEEYTALSDAVQAISGVRDPVNPKSVEQGVGGILRHAIGIGKSPKYATFQRKVVGSAVDTVGRGTITADADLDMDEVSIPADIAWTSFRPFIIRRLTRAGYSASDALKQVKERTPTALKELKAEMSERPVVYNRAPSLHQYSYVGAWGKLREHDDAIGLPYHVLKGIGGDYDGDNINIHVPSSSEAVDEVKQKLFPSKNLFHSATYETHLEPMQDYLAGLYLASRPDEKEKVQTFETVADARKAFAKGAISLRTPIRIMQSKPVG